MMDMDCSETHDVGAIIGAIVSAGLAVAAIAAAAGNKCHVLA